MWKGTTLRLCAVGIITVRESIFSRASHTQQDEGIGYSKQQHCQGSHAMDDFVLILQNRTLNCRYNGFQRLSLIQMMTKPYLCQDVNRMMWLSSAEASLAWPSRGALPCPPCPLLSVIFAQYTLMESTDTWLQ